jgi:hypothetical protein
MFVRFLAFGAVGLVIIMFVRFLAFGAVGLVIGRADLSNVVNLFAIGGFFITLRRFEVFYSIFAYATVKIIGSRSPIEHIIAHFAI